MDKRSTNRQLSLKRTRRGQFWGARVKPVVFFYLSSAEVVFQSQLSPLHKVSTTIPGHRGHGLIQLVQVLLWLMDSLLNRTNQTHRKQAAGGAHTPSSPVTEGICYLWITQLMCHSCAPPATLVRRSPNNKQDIWKLHKNDLSCGLSSSCLSLPWAQEESGLTLVHFSWILITSMALLHTRMSHLWDCLSVCGCDLSLLSFLITGSQIESGNTGKYLTPSV